MMIVIQGFLPVASRWHNDYESQLAYRCPEAGTLMKREILGRFDIIYFELQQLVGE